MKYEAAKQKVSEFANNDLDDEDELTISDEGTFETEFGWVFPCNSKKFLESGELSYTLLGNAPVIFDNRDETIHVTGTAYGIDRYIDLHRKNYMPTFSSSPERFQKRPPLCTS